MPPKMALPIDDPVRMQMAKCRGQLGRVEAGTLLRKPTLALQVKVQLAAVHVIDAQVQIHRCLKRIAQTHKEGMFGALLQDPSLYCVRVHVCGARMARACLTCHDATNVVWPAPNESLRDHLDRV